MLLINRHGPAELNQLFERISRSHMLSMLEDRNAFLPSNWNNTNWQEKKDHELLALVIPIIYAELTGDINMALRNSYNNEINKGKALVVYSPLIYGMNRGNLGKSTEGLLIIIEKIINTEERLFCRELFKPFPDIARRFDGNIF